MMQFCGPLCQVFCVTLLYVSKNKPSLGELLKAAREELKLSQRAVAKAAGMQLTSYQRFEKNESKLVSEHSDALSRVLNIPVPELLGILESQSFVPPMNGGQKVALLEYADAAKLADGKTTPKDLKAIGTATYHGERREMVFALRIEDGSMEPRFRKGDILAIDLSKRDKINPGSIVASAINHGQTVIGIYHSKRTGFEVHPLNPAYPSFDSEKDALKLIGTAFQLIQNIEI